MRRSSILIGLFAVACGGRPSGWDEPFEAEGVVGLQTAVAVMDPALDRVIMLESPGHLGLEASVLPVGKEIVTATASPQKDRLFVLSHGEQPRRKADDELPRLTVIDTLPTPEVARTYDLSDPFSGLSLDPQGQWAIVHAGEGVLENPNELILIDLEDPDAEPKIKSIRSFGGRPSRFTFTSPLSIGDEEPRRVLIVQTEQDLTLIDLMRLDDPEITVLTPETESGRFSQPALVAYHDADEDSDPVLAVSFANSSSVLLIGLVAGNANHYFLPMVWQNGGEIAREKDGRWASGMDSAEAVEAIQFYADLYAKERFAPEGALSWNARDVRAAFEAGDLAMMIGGAWDLRAIQKAHPELEGKIATALLPAGPAGSQDAFAGGSHLVVFEGTEHEALARRYVDFLAEPERVVAFSESIGFLPGSLAGITSIAASATPLYGTFTKQLTDHSRTYPPTTQWGSFEADGLFTNAVQQVMKGQRTAKEAMAGVAEAMNQAFEG